MEFGAVWSLLPSEVQTRLMLLCSSGVRVSSASPCMALYVHAATAAHVHLLQKKMCLGPLTHPFPTFTTTQGRRKETARQGGRSSRGEEHDQATHAKHHHTNITMARRLFLLAGLAVLASSSTSPSPSLRRQLSQYRDPTWNGLPIDYCLHYELVHYGPDNSLIAKHGHDCGQPAADEFCVRQGYKEGAEFFSAMYYSRNATYVLGDEAVNPTDTNMGKGEHTYIDKLTCKEKKGR